MPGQLVRHSSSALAARAQPDSGRGEAVNAQSSHSSTLACISFCTRAAATGCTPVPRRPLTIKSETEARGHEEYKKGSASVRKAGKSQTCADQVARGLEFVGWSSIRRPQWDSQDAHPAGGGTHGTRRLGRPATAVPLATAVAGDPRPRSKGRSRVAGAAPAAPRLHMQRAAALTSASFAVGYQKGPAVRLAAKVSRSPTTVNTSMRGVGRPQGGQEEGRDWGAAALQGGVGRGAQLMFGNPGDAYPRPTIYIPVERHVDAVGCGPGKQCGGYERPQQRAAGRGVGGHHWVIFKASGGGQGQGLPIVTADAIAGYTWSAGDVSRGSESSVDTQAHTRVLHERPAREALQCAGREFPGRRQSVC